MHLDTRNRCATGRKRAQYRELPLAGQPPALTALLLAAALGGCGGLRAGSAPRGVAAASPLAHIPVIELSPPARRDRAGDPTASEYFAILLTSDGGWAPTDRELAERIAAAGVPVVGWNSLRYYWHRKTPETATLDLARLIAHYGGRWHRPRVLLVGYSFGADVLPLLVNRLPQAERRRVAGLSLLGLSHDAIFEFHPLEWIGVIRAREHYPTVPEIARIDAVPITCIYGEKEHDTACTDLHQPNVRVYRFPGGHHFDLLNDLEAWAVLRTIGLGPFGA